MSICVAARRAAALSVLIDADNRASISAPHVVVKRDVAFAREQNIEALALTSTEFPGHAVVQRDYAIRHRLPIVWDPWRSMRAGDRLVNDVGAVYPADLVAQGTYAFSTLPTACAPVAQAHGGVSSTTLVIGGLMLLGVSFGAYYLFREH